ncbi:hypothetical protein D3C85_1394110 [compost metagenome]
MIGIQGLLRGGNLVAPSLQLKCFDAGNTKVFIQRGIEAPDKFAELVDAKQGRDQLALITWSSCGDATEVIEPVFLHEAETKALFVCLHLSRGSTI